MITDKLNRLSIVATDSLAWATKILASFEYRNTHGETKPGACKILVPPGDGPFPLYYQAGYERPDETLRSLVGFGCVVVNLVDPSKVGAAADTPLRRSINLDVALLHIARSLDCVDDARVVIGGASAGGYIAWMLTAETFPLAGTLPVAAQINTGYNLWYLARTQELQAGIDPPPMPGIHHAVPAGQLLWGAHHPRSEYWFQHSPVAHADAITSPVRLLHGTSDILHPVDQIARSLRRNPVDMPSGYQTTDHEPWVFLEDVFPDLHVAAIQVPDRARLLEVDGGRMDGWLYGMPTGEGSPTSRPTPAKSPPPIVSLPDPAHRVVACVVEDGGPSPRILHFRYRAAYIHGLFLSRALNGPCDAIAQYTPGKARVLEARRAGEEWIRTPLCHLDFSEAEAADVERAMAHVATANAG